MTAPDGGGDGAAAPGDARSHGSSPLTLRGTHHHDLLLNQFPAVAWTVDVEMRLTSWAGGVLKDLGYSESDLVGSHLAEFYATSPDPSAALAAHERALEGQTADFLITWNGRDFQAHVEPLRHDDGTVIGCVGVGLDVTDRNREADKAAKATRFRLALTTLVEEALRDELADRFYQRVAEVAVDAVPGAQASSVWLRGTDDRFHVAGSVGFDPEQLASVGFTPEEMLQGAAGQAQVQAGLSAIAEADPAKAERIRAAGPVSAIASVIRLPISVHGRTVAYLHLHSFDREDAFSDEEAEMARAFAGSLGLLVQRARLESELQEGKARLERLLEDYKDLAEFSAEIETVHDTDELIERGMERLLAALEFDTAMFGEVNDGAVHFTRLRGMVLPQIEATLRAPVPLGEGVNGRVAESGKPMFVRDYPAWTGGHAAYLPTGVESLVALPVKRAGRVRHTLSFGTVGRRASVDENDVRIASAFVARLENAFERVQYLEEIEATREATFRALGLALEYRDLETRGHTDRVVALADRFAEELALEQDSRQALVWGAYLHDLGKLAVPDTILLKPGRLTEQEFDVIRQHTLYGTEMTRAIPFLPTGTREVIRSHHERWDGGGYPDRLSGDEVPLLARMFSLVDVYDALTSVRPYKPAWAHGEAAAELRRQAGRQFEAELVKAFLSCLSRGRDSDVRLA